MRISAGIILFFLMSSVVYSQKSCDQYIADNSRQGNTHFIKTKFESVVVRGQYTYSMAFLNSSDGLSIVVRSLNGGILNRDDEIIFIDVNNVQKSFRFPENGQVKRAASAIIHENKLAIDLNALDWLAENKLGVFYVKNQIKSSIRKLSLNVNRQQVFWEIAKCFSSKLDRSLVKKRNLSTIDFHSAEQNFIGSNTIQQKALIPDAELVDLHEQLAAAKERVRKQILAQEDKVLRVKELLNDEIKLARKNAELEKIKLAEEVVLAREKSFEEILKGKETKEKKLREQIEEAQSVKFKISSNVDSVRDASILEIEHSRLRAAEQIALNRKKAHEEILSIHEKVAEVRLQYADEISGSKENANIQIDKIRSETADNLSKMKMQYAVFKNENDLKLSEAQKSLLTELQRMQEELAAEVGQYRENAAIQKEEENRKLAELRRSKAEEMAILMEENLLQITSLKEAFLNEKDQLTNELAMAKTKISEQLNVQKQQLLQAQSNSALKMSEMEKVLSDTLNKYLAISSKQKAKILERIVESNLTANAQVLVAEKEMKEKLLLIKKKEKEEHEKALIEMDQFQKSIEEEKRKMGEDLLQMKKSWASKEELLRLESEKEVDRIRQNKELEIALYSENARKILKGQALSLETSIAHYEKSVLKAKAHAENKIDEINKQLDSDLAKIEQDHRDTKNATLSDLEKVQSSIQNEILKLNKNAAEKRAQLARLVAENQRDFEIELALIKGTFEENIVEFQRKEQKKTFEILTKENDLRENALVAIEKLSTESLVEIKEWRERKFTEIKNAQDAILESKINSKTMISQIQSESLQEAIQLKQTLAQDVMVVKQNASVEIGKILTERNEEIEDLRSEMSQAQEVAELEIANIKDRKAAEMQMIIEQSAKEKSIMLDSLQSERTRAYTEVEAIKKQLSEEVFLSRKLALEQINKVKQEAAIEIELIRAEVAKARQELKSVKEGGGN